MVLYIAAQAQKQRPILAQVRPVNVQVTLQDDHLIRHPANPLLSRGPKGSFDQLKIGPRAILREGPNDWKMWYEGAPAGNKSSVGYATSSDGLNWTKYPGNPIMIPSEPWEGGHNGFVGETSPATVLKEDGIYKMWYHSINASKVRQIGYATSTDAINWSKYRGNPTLRPGSPGAWDSGGIGEPTVIKVGSIFYMYYMRTIEKHGIGLATSPDGIYWTKYSDNPILTVGKPGSWDGGAMQIGGVVHEGNMFHMWFRARDAQWNFAIGYAWSVDGKGWAKSPKNPILSKPNPPIRKGDDYGVESNTNAFRFGDQWWIYYGGFVSCCPQNIGVNLATYTVKSSPLPSR
jgi:predicted GH43/DUF377 family glycosyl hydrolase